MIGTYAGVALLGYLLGSIPSAYMAGQLLHGIDIRQVGDGNAGAANVFRELGATAGIAVGLVDISKGALAALLAQTLTLSQGAAPLAGAAAVAGHNWPVWIGFRGGRGEATTIGVVLYLMPIPMLLALAAGSLAFLLTRDVLSASAAMFIFLPLAAWFLGASVFLIGYGIALPCLVGVTHYLTTGRGKLPTP